MKTKNEICECGHNNLLHREKEYCNGYYENSSEQCDCKKFTPKIQSQDVRNKTPDKNIQFIKNDIVSLMKIAKKLDKENSLSDYRRTKAISKDMRLWADINPYYFEEDVKSSVKKILERILKEVKLRKNKTGNSLTDKRYEAVTQGLVIASEIIKSEMGKELT